MTLSEAYEILHGQGLHFGINAIRDGENTMFNIISNNQSSDEQETAREVEAMNVLLNNFLNQSQQFVMVY